MCESLQRSKERGSAGGDTRESGTRREEVLIATFLCFSNDGTEFAGSIYQKVNSNLETAVHLAWTAGSNNTRFGIGAKYQLDKDASLSVSNQPEQRLQCILLLQYSMYPDL